MGGVQVRGKGSWLAPSEFNYVSLVSFIHLYPVRVGAHRAEHSVMHFTEIAMYILCMCKQLSAALVLYMVVLLDLQVDMASRCGKFVSSLLSHARRWAYQSINVSHLGGSGMEEHDCSRHIFT